MMFDSPLAGLLSGAIPVASQSAPIGAPQQQSAPPAIPETSFLGRLFGGLLGGGGSTPAPGIGGAQEPSFLGKLGDTLHNNSLMLMALGGGMMGAPTFGMGLSRGMQAAIPAMHAQNQLALQQYQIALQQQNMKATFAALQKMGASPEEALAAAAGNQDIMKAVVAKYVEPAGQWVQGPTDQFGGTHPGVFNPRSQTFTPASQLPLGAITQGAGPGAQSDGSQAGPAGSSFFAKGVTAVDSDLVGDDYLKQFSPEVRAAVLNYIDGKTMPSGYSRPGFVQTVKAIAQKYSNDIGQPADDTTFVARRQMRNQLSSANPSSIGGQLNAGNTAMDHLADVSDAAVALNNYPGEVPGFGSVAPLAHAENALRGWFSGTQSPKVKALMDAAQHYGQEITKFYAGSPGGEQERQRFMTSINGVNTPAELASVIQQERILMEGRLASLGDQIQGTLGDRGTQQYPVVRPKSTKALDRITQNIGVLQGAGAAPAPSQEAQAPQVPAPPIAGGRYIWDQSTGKMVPMQ